MNATKANTHIYFDSACPQASLQSSDFNLC